MQRHSRKDFARNRLLFAPEKRVKVSLSRVASGFLVLAFVVQTCVSFSLSFDVLTPNAYAAPVSAQVTSASNVSYDTANNNASSNIKKNRPSKHTLERQNSRTKTNSPVAPLRQFLARLEQNLDAATPLPVATPTSSQPSSSSVASLAKTVPTFAHTYYANYYNGSSSTDPGDCNKFLNSDCSLQAAVALANLDNHGSTPDLVVITTTSSFNPTSAISVTSNVYLSASSDLSCSSSNLATLNFSSATASNTGLVLNGSDYVNALQVSSSPKDGLDIYGSANQVTCFKSTSNINNGVTIESGASSNKIGGINSAFSVSGYSVAVEVVIGNNNNNGIEITGTNTISNVVENSAIGYLPGFNGSYSNAYGIKLEGGASNNQIGGNGTGQRNYIGGNSTADIDLRDSGTTGNHIYNNYINTDNTGNSLISGSGTNYGIVVENNASNNQIGGDRSANYSNLINAATAGILLTNSSNTVIQGNLIGVSAALTGTVSLSTSVGIFNIQGAQNTVIGGAEDSSNHFGNIIGGNGAGIQNGATIAGGSVLTATISGNYIGTDPNGDSLPNQYGVMVGKGTSTAIIGGAATNLGNYVGSNAYTGIAVFGTYTDTVGVAIENNFIGIKPDRSASLYNGTSAGSNNGSVVCNPGGNSDTVSELCDGISILSSGVISGLATTNPGPITQILSNTIAANNSYSLNDSLGQEDGAVGILLDYVNDSTLQNNSIGAYLSGSLVTPYQTNIAIELLNGSSNNQIGGDRTLGQGNLVAATVYDGIGLYEQAFDNNPYIYSDMVGNKVQGNYVGVDKNGNFNYNLGAVGGDYSDSYGIDLFVQNGVLTTTVTNNLVGVDFSVSSPNLNTGNLVGDVGEGIYLGCTDGGITCENNQINGNHVGTNLAATSANAATLRGIHLEFNVDNTTVEANYVGVSGIPDFNDTNGIYLLDTVTNTTIISNYIGTNANGSNFGMTHDVWLELDNKGTAAPSHNIIKNNTIAYSRNDGVALGDSPIDTYPAQNNTISQNSIYGNKGLGINDNYADSDANGVAGGNDSDINNAAQEPTILSGSVGYKEGVKASGTANPNSIVEVFLADSSAITNTQGKVYLGTANADDSGNFSLDTTLSGSAGLGSTAYLVATSTLDDSNHANRIGSTSQFSPIFTPTVFPSLLVTPTVLTFTAAGSSPLNQSLNLNASLGNVDYSATISYTSDNGSDWLTLNPSGGTVASGATTTITATANPANLTTGTYTAVINFTDNTNSNDSGESIPVTLTVPFYSLNVSPSALNFTATVGSTDALAQNLTLTSSQGSIGYSSSISYTSGSSSSWLNISPSSGTVASSLTLTATADPTNLTAGTYTADINFVNTTNANSSTIVIPVTFTVSSTPITTPVSSGYTYYLPFVANNALSFTTYLAFQNVGSATANVTINYYDSNGAVLSSGNVVTQVVQYGEVLPSNPFASGTKGAGIITSDQPLNVIVPEATPYGGSAYAVGSGSSNSLIAPFALNNAFGDFTTQLNIFNGGNAAATATVTFYGTVGNSTTIVTKTNSLTIAAHTTTNLNQTALASGFNGWARISGNASTLVAQVLEQSPSSKFVAIANAAATSSTTEYAPAIFNDGYGSFFTGANIINPNNSAVTVYMKYYDKDTGAVLSAPPFVIQGYGVGSVFQGSSNGNGIPTGGLPSNFVGAVAVTSVGGPIAMSVNENGGLTAAGNSRSGTYAALASGAGTVGLPVVSNGGYTYITGDTIFNTSSQPVTATINYYNVDGTMVSGASKTFTVTATSSVAFYQGDGTLPANFYGTAVITESADSPANALIVTTNAQNAALFYTYSEPNG